MISTELKVTVPFNHVDVMEVAWHGHYVEYFERARCAALATIGYDYPQMQASGYHWPVIDLHLRYTKVAKYGQVLTVRAELKEWENRLRFTYVITDEQGQRLTKGESVQVAVHAKTGEMCFISPPILFEKLGLPQPKL